MTIRNYSTRDVQIRINSLNLVHPYLAVDGMMGPKTRAAIKEALEEIDVSRVQDLFDDSGITRIHWHWTAGASTPNSTDIRHYNDVFDVEGNQYDGRSPASQQALYQVGRIGVSHTRSANTGAVGMSLCAMGDARPNWGQMTVDQGKWPLTWEAINAMLERTADYCRDFDVKVSPWTTISHAEVQGNIGIPQRGKWDIRVLPDKPDRLRSAKECGDILRDMLREKLRC
jgi:hypothetical protein